MSSHSSGSEKRGSSTSPPYDDNESDDDDDSGDDDGGSSLAELTSYSRESRGSGVELHPHHKRGVRHGGASIVSSTSQYSAAGRHELGNNDSRHRKKYDDEENQSLLSQQQQQRQKSSSRNKRSSRHHSSSSSTSSNGRCACITNLLDGINFKTVLLCVIAMAMVMKMNQPPPSPNSQHGMHHYDPSSASTVRGAALSSTNGELPKSHPSHPDYNLETATEKLQKLLQSPESTQDDIQSALKARMGEYASTLDPDQLSDGPSAELVMQRSAERQKKREEERQKNLLELNAKLEGTGGGLVGGEGQQQQQQQQQQQPGIPPPPPLDGQQPGIPPPFPQGQYYQPYDPSQQQQQVPPPNWPFPQGQMQPQNWQQQGYYQNGYYVPLQQQPGVAGGYAQPFPQQQLPGMAPQIPPITNNNYAVSGQSTFNQSPLEWQQQQIQQQQLQQQAAAPSQGDSSQHATPEGESAPPPPPAPPASSTGEVTADQVPLVDVNSESALVTTSSFSLEELNNFKDSWDPYEKTDIPVFWHIPKAGGSSIKDAMGGCHRFVQATEFGITDGHDADTEVAIVYPRVPGDANTDRSPFVNIDSSTVAGIQRAKAMGFADAQLADVVVSPFVYELNDLFTKTARGRFFSVFRHPIDRAVSMFYYIRVADWEPSYKPELKDWTLEQYAQSDIVENNWMTRQLSNQLGGELTEENLNKAMEVVRRKFLVGLMSQIEPTMARAEKFFRWTFHVNPPNQEACRERLMSGGANSNKANKKEGPKEGDEAWNLLAHQNNFDLRLYTYIEQLFVEQEAFVTGLPDNFRNVDATCCKCYPQTFPPEGFTCPEAVKNGDAR